MNATERKALEVLDNVKKHVKKHNIGYSIKGGAVRDKEGQPEGMVQHPDDLVGLHASTHILVKDMADLMTKRYPGFRWAIQPNERGGVFNIFCLDFHGVWGYVIRYDDVMNDPKRRQALIACSEILKRFRYPGTKYDPAKIALMPRNMQGECIPDVSDMKPTRFTKHVQLQQQLADGHAKVVGTAKGGHIIEVVEQRKRR